MRHTVKLLPVLLLGSALGGCSMAGTGDFFADDFANTQSWAHSGQYGQTACGQAPVIAQPQVVAQPQTLQPAGCAQPNFAQAQFAQGQFAQGQVLPGQVAQGQFVQGQVAQPNFVQPNAVQPHFAQGGFVQPQFAQGAYVPPTFGVNSHGLRGPKKVSNSYAYGTLGGIAYDVGDDIYGIQGRLGYQFNRFFGAEVEGSFGVVDDTNDFTLAGGDVVEQEIDIDTSVAGFGVIRYPLFGKFSGLSRVGYHSTEVEVELTDAAGVSVEDEFNTDGLAYGTGIEYAFDPKTSVRFDYTVYDFDGPDADSLSLAVSRKF